MAVCYGQLVELVSGLRSRLLYPMVKRLAKRGGKVNRLVIVAARDYAEDVGGEFAAGIGQQLDEVEKWWCDPSLGERGFVRRRSEWIRSRSDIEKLIDAEGLRDLAEEDAVVVYIAAHGEFDEGRHYLRLPESAARGSNSLYPSADLLQAVLDSGARHVLCIVNACHAGNLSAELERLAPSLLRDDDSQTRHVFTAGDFYQRPEMLDLTTVLQTVRQRLLTGMYSGPLLSMDAFWRELDDAAEGSSIRPCHIFGTRQTSRKPSPCLPNPGYRAPDNLVATQRQQLAATKSEVEYWLARASGRTSDTDPGWYFSGRKELTQKIAYFFRESAGMLIVTGTAGSGKSALIARAVTLSDQQFRRDPRYGVAVAAADPATVPEMGCIDVAVLARNKDSGQLLIELADAMGVRAWEEHVNRDQVAALRAAVGEYIAARQQVITIVVDGLDESPVPLRIIADVISPLSRYNIRWVIGVRSDRPRLETGALNIHPTLIALKSVAVVDMTELRTDGPDITDDIEMYVAAVLEGDSPYNDDAQACRAAAITISQRVVDSFLDARIAADQLRKAKLKQDLDDVAWLRSLGEGTVGLLRRDLRSWAHASGLPEEHALAVMQAAAFAGGRGVPIGLWETIATAIHAAPLSEGVVARVLSGALAGYLSKDSSRGDVVYRPVHDRLREILQQPPSTLANGGNA
ncbi:AAA family ATPase [Nocardia sp. NPDC058658]|uniref:AAA family ATPase n=1 Tax=Nocardia sp. NPDC058658 TaxID=3346580 RepID=UPI00365489BF